MVTAAKQAERDFVTKMRSLPYTCVFRFSDTADVIKSTGGKLPSTPSDFIVVSKGRTFFAEIKTSVNPKKFPPSNLRRKSQLGARKLVLACGGDYQYYIYSIFHQSWFILSAKDATIRKNWKWSALPKLILW